MENSDKAMEHFLEAIKLLKEVNNNWVMFSDGKETYIYNTKDGQVFIVRPQLSTKSPFDVRGIDLGISTREILGFIAEGRRSFD
jgi:hypothetical protein